MSLDLTMGTDPVVRVAISFDDKQVWLSNPSNPSRLHLADISMVDFCEMVKYVLTNTNLLQDDPRFALVRDIKQITVVRGYGEMGQRLALKG